MRYIGNKTRLLPFILRTLKRSGIGVGSVHDAFAGTASVSRALKEKGWRVHSSDLLMSSYVFQRAYVAADSADPSLQDMVRELGSIAQKAGFMTAHCSPAIGTGGSGRMYFTPENAGRIDAAREELERWRKGGKLDEDNYFLLLAAIIEAADRVANTAGVYASYMKRWQPNAKRRFQLVAAAPAQSAPPARALLVGATDPAQAVRRVCPLLLDPPFNPVPYAC